MTGVWRDAHPPAYWTCPFCRLYPRPPLKPQLYLRAKLPAISARLYRSGKVGGQSSTTPSFFSPDFTTLRFVDALV